MIPALVRFGIQSYRENSSFLINFRFPPSSGYQMVRLVLHENFETYASVRSSLIIWWYSLVEDIPMERLL